MRCVKGVTKIICKYIGMQETGSGRRIRLYNIEAAGHELDGSTVCLRTLMANRINEVPELPHEERVLELKAISILDR